MCPEDPSSAPMAYFSHDSNSAMDIKCRRLLKAMGYEGYGRWWRVCELMAAATGHSLPVSEEMDAEILADELGFKGVGDLTGFLRRLCDFGLVSADALSGGRVESARMMRNAGYMGKRRATAMANGRKGGRPPKRQGSSE